MQTLVFSTRSFIALTVIGVIFLLLFAGFVFSSGTEALIDPLQNGMRSGLTNSTLVAQVSAVIFWVGLLLLPGMLFMRIFVRPDSLLESFVISVVTGFLFIGGALFTAPFIVRDYTVSLQLTVTLALLFMSALAGVMLLICREVITAMFFSK